MPSLGEVAESVRVRAAGHDEALLLAALHKQALVRGGEDPDARLSGPTHVRAFAQAWHQRAADLPAWIAEHDGKHVGVALARRPVLPHIDGAPQLLLLAALDGSARVGDEAVCLALTRAVVAWARESGSTIIRVPESVRLPPSVLDAARATIAQSRVGILPTRP